MAPEGNATHRVLNFTDMAMQSQGLRQVQKQTQNLVLAPQLRQSLKILQVPALELRSAILEELQTNPLLEEVGTNDESLDAENLEPSPDEPTDSEGEEFPDDPVEAEANEADADDDWGDDAQEDLMDMDFSDEFSILKEMQEDLREHFEREYLFAQVSRFGGNISQTASFIGMERSALHRKLKLLGVKEFN